MQINISEIISTDYKVQTFNPEIEMEVFCLDGERYNFIRKSPVELKAQNEGHSVVNLSGHVDVTIDIPCSRCLTSVPTRLAFDFSQKVDFEKLKAEQLDDLDETSFMEESSLDVDRFVYNEILMRFPMKTLCREDSSKARRDSRRANWKMSVPSLSKCSKCGALVMPHRVCKACGAYNKKEVVKVQ